MEFFAKVTGIELQAVNGLLSSPAVRDFVNGMAGRYAEVLSMAADSQGLHVLFTLLGQSERVEAVISRIELRDGKLILSGLSASQPWARNLFADFLEGRELPAPGLPFQGEMILHLGTAPGK